MPRAFFNSTAEQVVQVVDAVHIKRKADTGFIEKFCELTGDQVASALALAKDMGLIKESSGEWSAPNILAGFFGTAVEEQKAAALRIALEKYQPFIVFRERLSATSNADKAAQETKTILELDMHRTEIKDTLISLGTYTGAISIQGGGRYSSSDSPLANQLKDLASVCADVVAAEARIRIQIGERNNQADRQEVIIPLAQALLKAARGQASDAVKDSAVAYESFLAHLAGRMGVSLTGADSIIEKLERFRTGSHLPKKIVEAGKYLGQVRNAADHGVDVDPDVGAVWRIQDSTGLLYVYVTCSLVAACLEREVNGQFII
jgi:hypothetical protein